MLILSEAKLRKVIREELERFMEIPQEKPQVYSIKGVNGGELIMPNPTKEMFDTGQVKSLKDII